MRTLIAIAALAYCAAAQSLSGTITTTGPYGNYVRQGSIVAFASWPANKSFQPGLVEMVGPRLNNSNATTDIRWRVQPGPVLMMTVSEGGTRLGSAAAGSTSSTSATISRSISDSPRVSTAFTCARNGSSRFLRLGCSRSP